MKTLALIDYRDFKYVINQVRSGKVSLFVNYVKGELKIDGKVYAPGKYMIPRDSELMARLDKHYICKKKLGKRLTPRSTERYDPLRNLVIYSRVFRITRLMDTHGAIIPVTLELPLDRIEYGEFTRSPYSKELTRAIQLHEEYWAEGKPGVNQDANILDLENEGFTNDAAKRIDKIVRKKK